MHYHLFCIFVLFNTLSTMHRTTTPWYTLAGYILLLWLSHSALLAQNRPTTPLEQQMEKAGLVDLQRIDSTIHVSLMYTRADNFTGRILYTDLTRAYLHPIAAEALRQAQAALKRVRPDLSLKVYDATRPMRVQQRMWNAVKGTSQAPYVSNPANGGGLHNYGMAVDLTLCHATTGDTLPMGVLIDHLGPRSHIDQEDRLVQQGLLSPEARANRQLLRQVMTAGGFKPLRTEWWHFNRISRAEAKRHYKAIP